MLHNTTLSCYFLLTVFSISALVANGSRKIELNLRNKVRNMCTIKTVLQVHMADVLKGYDDHKSGQSSGAHQGPHILGEDQIGKKQYLSWTLCDDHVCRSAPDTVAQASSEQ